MASFTKSAPAAQCGVLVNDELLAVGGISVRDEDWSSVKPRLVVRPVTLKFRRGAARSDEEHKENPPIGSTQRSENMLLEDASRVLAKAQ